MAYWASGSLTIAVTKIAALIMHLNMKAIECALSGNVMTCAGFGNRVLGCGEVAHAWGGAVTRRVWRLKVVFALDSVRGLVNMKIVPK